MKDTASNPELKKLVGEAAAKLIKDDMICGIGTGSTVACFIASLGWRIREERLKFTGVPTSYQSRMLCETHGVSVAEPERFTFLDLAVDGADEVDPSRNAIKGGGAAHTREKIIAAMARQYVLIIDGTKFVPELGHAFPVPVEVIPAALRYVHETIIRLGGEPELRMALRKDGPVITDNGQFIIDVRFKNPVNLREFDRCLHFTPGVVETGLFFDLAHQVLVGTTNGVKVV